MQEYPTVKENLEAKLRNTALRNLTKPRYRYTVSRNSILS
jgi:hypothetical protein